MDTHVGCRCSYCLPLSHHHTEQTHRSRMPAEHSGALQRQLTSAFSQQLSSLSEEDARDSLSAAESLCTSFCLDPDDLFFKWEAFSMDNALLAFTPSNIQAFRQNLSSSVEKASPRVTPRNVLSTTRRGKSSLYVCCPSMVHDNGTRVYLYLTCFVLRTCSG